MTSSSDLKMNSASLVCLKPSELQKEMIDEVKKVQDMAPFLTKTEARLLLSKHKWMINETLIAEFDLSKTKLNAVKNVSASKSSTCRICLDQVNEYAELPCSHKFCNQCIKCHISEIIMNDVGTSREAIYCPGVDCKNLLDDEFVLKALSDHQMKEKYYKIITCNFVMNNALINHCPREKCSNAIKLSGDELLEISVCCSCCHWFCFKCQADAHEPLSRGGVTKFFV